MSAVIFVLPEERARIRARRDHFIELIDKRVMTRKEGETAFRIERTRLLGRRRGDTLNRGEGHYQETGDFETLLKTFPDGLILKEIANSLHTSRSFAT